MLLPEMMKLCCARCRLLLVGGRWLLLTGYTEVDMVTVIAMRANDLQQQIVCLLGFSVAGWKGLGRSDYFFMEIRLRKSPSRHSGDWMRADVKM